MEPDQLLPTGPLRSRAWDGEGAARRVLGVCSPALGLGWGPAHKLNVGGEGDPIQHPHPRPEQSCPHPPAPAQGPGSTYPFIPHWGPQEFFTIQ